MNPYKLLDIYKKTDIEEYRGRYMYEKPPHIFALSNNAFRSMTQNKENQCIIISGESGAGKTEASKKIMQFISAVSKSREEVARVKDKLLDSNPVLEAFGNAKTLRNDNSSRFGKYMEIQFDHGSAPIGGRINIYLLEKSRVVSRTVGERSFHIFYQLLKGLSESELNALSLVKDPNAYEYLRCSRCDTVDTINDQMDFKEVKHGMQTLGFTEDQKSLIFRLIAAILLLGNVTFQEDKANSTVGESKIQVANFPVVEKIAELLQVDPYGLKAALTSRQISTGVSRRVSVIHINLDDFQAKYTRDALAKALYSLLFSWLVERINDTIHSGVARADSLVIGVLDIYGFEIFEKNSFEQFCINYCNEKLQQLFIELTLKTEQEEYVREGIRWTPVEYFNNKIICDLIDAKPIGVIALLDETCLVANSTDLTFLDKLNRSFNKHKHYESYGTTNNRQIPNDTFRLKHYAGDVNYCVENFLSKNKDTLFLDLVNICLNSKNPLLPALFKDINTDSKKRPVTAGTQFKTSLQGLVDTLLKCRPHYTRCIKPNGNKRPGLLDETLVRHQIRYLGLVENLRVRRAGYANRQTYDRFLRRYKMICKSTWPHWRGDDRSGTQAIVEEIGIPNEEYCMGKTKIFIKNPTTLFTLEEKREAALPKVVILMQKVFRGYMVRRRLAKKAAGMKILLYYRCARSRKYFAQIQEAYKDVKNDPKMGKDIPFPPPPPALKTAGNLVHRVLLTWRAAKMIRALGKEKEGEMRQKVCALDIFKGKKPWDMQRKYDADYLELDSNPYKAKYIERVRLLFSTYGDQQILFADFAMKLNRYNKAQKVGIVVTDRNIYKQDPKSYKVVKFGTPIANLHSVSMSPFKDDVVVLHCKEETGMRDLVLNFGLSGQEKYAEFVVVVTQLYNQLTSHNLPVKFSESIAYNNARTKAKTGSTSMLTFASGTVQHTTFIKGKKSQNQVLYPQ
eukprot:TRINITY_DN3559_c0_g1_i1.p1 TRINITY_DN3559_c0_g1~~TRINITY_DN3559_c0_g1_i1.p1  ORF type:complete len:962 (+),score=289.09 TRINITY_DN3559_c0_g1_i1:505-3390(+)